ncbi:MAG TPA: BON domain-containing protein [Ktedonobacteraceae bacterium]|nr:BON domain-containing protein [Ktedonobacteraceae bacterium]
MQKFLFGSKVFCSDGEDGILVHVIFDATTRCMSHIGVKQGRFFGKTVTLPYENIVSASGEGIMLNLKRAEVAAAHNASGEGAMLDSKSVVENAAVVDKGTLLLVALQPESGMLAYLVAHHLRPGQDTFIHQEYVTQLATGQVKVNIPPEQLAALPPYRSDRELQQEVEAILFDIQPFHIDLKGMIIHVLDSVLYLDGNISSSLRSEMASDQVLGVPGLMEIRNSLIGDDTLAGNLAMVLGRDPRTRDLPIGVYPRLGDVRLSGAVHNGQQKEAATEIAKSFAGVRSVFNDLVVNPKADSINVMSPAEGGEAEDLVPGKYIRHTK